MKTADRFLAGPIGPPFSLRKYPAQAREWRDATASTTKLLPTVPHLLADNVARYVFESPKGYVLEEFPCLAPPWPVFWIEYRSRSGRQRRGVLVRDISRDLSSLEAFINLDHGENAANGAEKDARENGYDGEIRWLVEFTLYVENQRHQVIGPMGWVVLALDPRGRCVGNRWVIGIPRDMEKPSADRYRYDEVERRQIGQTIQALTDTTSDEAAAESVISDEQLTAGLLSAYQTLAFLHCFGGATEVVTRDGVQPIADLAGSEAELLTKDMGPTAPRSHVRWVRARVESFGWQPTLDLRLRRSGHEQVIRTTSGHRWFVGASARRRVAREVTTAELRPGDRLVTVRPSPAGAVTKESAIGVAHGLVYGDGSRNAHESWAEFLGEDREEMLRFFPSPRVTRLPDRSTGAIRVSGLPRSFKELPREDEGTAYLFSFLAGWFAADGSVGKQGQVTLCCVNPDALHWMRRVGLSRLGMVMGAPRMQMREGIDGKMRPLWSMLIDRGSVSARFFIRSHHRRAFESLAVQANPNRWEVVGVEPSGEVEEVYCAVVPGTETFVLDGMILTGNCRNVKTDQVGIPPKLDKRHLRDHGRSLLRFQTVRLDVPRKGSNSTGKGPSHVAPALHIVPGNFHHYGDCCPGGHEPKGLLFGKLTGVYWVPQHARGSAARGEVRSDFDLQVKGNA